jgi:hypothetical protein
VELNGGKSRFGPATLGIMNDIDLDNLLAPIPPADRLRDLLSATLMRAQYLRSLIRVAEVRETEQRVEAQQQRTKARKGACRGD